MKTTDGKSIWGSLFWEVYRWIYHLLESLAYIIYLPNFFFYENIINPPFLILKSLNLVQLICTVNVYDKILSAVTLPASSIQPTLPSVKTKLKNHVPNLYTFAMFLCAIVVNFFICIWCAGSCLNYFAVPLAISVSHAGLLYPLVPNLSTGIICSIKASYPLNNLKTERAYLPYSNR